MLIPLLLTPIYLWIATPFIRPFRWRRLFWTYVVPLVPLTCWWDGLVSQFRAYTPSELEDLASRTEIDRIVDELYVYARMPGTIGCMPRVVESWGQRPPA